jgi:hypothetical protein
MAAWPSGTSGPAGIAAASSRWQPLPLVNPNRVGEARGTVPYA